MSLPVSSNYNQYYMAQNIQNKPKIAFVYQTNNTNLSTAHIVPGDILTSYNKN